jgi:hypothetical protein
MNLLMLYQILCILPICQTLLPAFSHLRFTSFVLISSQIQTLLHLTYDSPHIPPRFDVFRPATSAEGSKLISESPDTHCDLDPSTLLKEFTSALLPIIVTIINLSVASEVFPVQFKSSSVHPLLKKSNSDKNELSNYHLPHIFLSFLNSLSV